MTDTKRDYQNPELGRVQGIMVSRASNGAFVEVKRTKPPSNQESIQRWIAPDVQTLTSILLDLSLEMMPKPRPGILLAEEGAPPETKDS